MKRYLLLLAVTLLLFSCSNQRPKDSKDKSDITIVKVDSSNVKLSFSRLTEALESSETVLLFGDSVELEKGPVKLKTGELLQVINGEITYKNNEAQSAYLVTDLSSVFTSDQKLNDTLKINSFSNDSLSLTIDNDESSHTVSKTLNEDGMRLLFRLNKEEFSLTNVKGLREIIKDEVVFDLSLKRK